MEIVIIVLQTDHFCLVLVYKLPFTVTNLKWQVSFRETPLEAISAININNAHHDMTELDSRSNSPLV